MGLNKRIVFRCALHQFGSKNVRKKLKTYVLQHQKINKSVDYTQLVVPLGPRGLRIPS
jgi:hypothetical protein